MASRLRVLFLLLALLVPGAPAHAHPPAFGFVATGAAYGILGGGNAVIRMTFRPCTGVQTVTEQVTYNLSGETTNRSYTGYFEILEPAVSSGCAWDFDNAGFRFYGLDRYFFLAGGTHDFHVTVTGAMGGEWAAFWLGSFALTSV